MIPNIKPAVILLCGALCALPGAWAQTAADAAQHVAEAPQHAAPAVTQDAAPTPAQASVAVPAPVAAPVLAKPRIQPQLSDSIVVVVNDEVITSNDLTERMAFIEKNMKTQGVALPPPAEFRKQVLERMIVDRAQLQLAKEDGVRVDDLMLDRYIGRIAEANKMTMQQFRDQIEHDGTSFGKFREAIRDEIMMQRVREHEVESKLQITESEVDNYLAAQNGLTSAQPELDLAQILVGIPENASAEQ
ncbi:MAG: SurA N-terminal domain-containing protein, partial [Burkholderiales bacterium]